jgi:hypothetical protein
MTAQVAASAVPACRMRASTGEPLNSPERGLSPREVCFTTVFIFARDTRTNMTRATDLLYPNREMCE